MEANAEISRQAQTISKLEQDLNRLDKSSDMTSKRLEAENNSLHLHLSKLEQQLLDAKLSYHDLQSNLKHTSNELVSSKQSQGTSSCVCILYSNHVVTVSLSRVWFIDEMNPGNDYYSSPDQHMGNQKAPKIEIFN